MTAIEDPGSDSEPVDSERPSDDLELWLSDLRTEEAAEQQERDSEPPPVEKGGGGRHRAPE